MQHIKPALKIWLRISMFNLILVAFLGVLMRYKIAYAFPIVDQKNLLQAHSHFAFAGWITQALMSLMVNYLSEKENGNVFIRYRPVLLANLLSAYGMLVTFPFMGYSFLPIAFSTLSILVSYWFAIQFWRDLNRLPFNNSSHSSFKAALFFSVLSSAGAFSLAVMIATRNIQPDRYLASVYFFLHFQYSGWFYFSCLGLVIDRLIQLGVTNKKLKQVFLLFVIACPPAYFLTELWMPIAHWIYVLIVAAVLMQLIGWWMMIGIFRKVLPPLQKNFSPLSKSLFILSAVALTIKFLLQAISVIPSLSYLAFGFRPIVIGYLHLVFLGVITLFIFAFIAGYKFITVNKMTQTGIIIFTIGIIVNEVLLMIQGISDLSYHALPIMNPLLLVAALILFTGITITVSSQRSSPQNQQYTS